MQNNSENEKSIQQLLTDYSKTDAYPFHMPGHKRNKYFSEKVNYPFSVDITEITGFDDLHNPSGILKSSMQKASELFGSKHSFYLVNGSTCGILSSVFSLTNYGDTVIVARNCHKSVFNAIELRGLKPVFLMPEFDSEFEIAGSINPQSVENALNKNKNAKIVLITSPTYEGVTSDIEKIAEICHRFCVPLIVDEAHGAHFAFSDFFPKTAIECGADVVIQSLHKTLPCPTQTAILHIQGELVCEKDINRSLDIFQTSSPSYPMMSSIDFCIRELHKNSGMHFESYEKLLTDFSQKMKKLKNLKVLCFGEDLKENHKAIFDYDRSKIVISCTNTNINGKELFSVLRDKYFLELEMTSKNYVIAMTSICDTEEGLQRLSNALLEIDGSIKKTEDVKKALEYVCSELIYPPAQAVKMQSQECELAVAENKISGEYIWAYPPGIPIVITGEIITREIVKNIKSHISNRISLISTSGLIDRNKILVIEQNHTE